jgi:hypothetical protein
MRSPGRQLAFDYAEAIRSSGLTIYDLLPKDSPLFIPTKCLEALLDDGLKGFNTSGLPLRTRSKVVKSEVCRVLGYPVPKSFKKCKPYARFAAQNFDTYVQAANNLQIWNDELNPRRRYVLVSVGETGLVERVRVVTGSALAKLDTTGKLTQKFQARFGVRSGVELISPLDTKPLQLMLGGETSRGRAKPTDEPQKGSLLPIERVFSLLKPIVGTSFEDSGVDQERNRGAVLHRLVCKALGYASYADDGQFPDVRNQLLEVKLQTAPTIDLGLVEPACTELLDVEATVAEPLRHCDVRYAVFGAERKESEVKITSLVMTTGEAFYSRFPRCEGRVLNKKLQIPLRRDFFQSKR